MNEPKVEESRKWDRHAINAEIRRRGMTLTGIAKDAGLYGGACRQGIIGLSRPGAEAIATALGLPFRELFPDLYTRGRHDERKSSRNTDRVSSAKIALNLDAAPGAT
jgi:lambda repressor-like predicted transcriptional regulator